ncbi:MAG TPA: hypothetical protein VJN50_08205 [Actinomycetota bacterium]|nr:hypothetical protein [Actinomycetota bacterium]
MKHVLIRFATVLALTLPMLATVSPADAAHSTFGTGDVFVSVSGGKVQWRHSDGELNATLDTGLGGFTTGMAFDAAGKLYVTNFGANAISVFDTDGTLHGVFASDFDSSPESIDFDTTGHAYVGQADGTHEVWRFNSAGSLLDSFAPAVENRGTDWIDLAPDGCTLFYTSEGVNVKRFDVCTKEQLAYFNAEALPGTNAFALRLLPDGRVLVADSESIVRLDADGMQTDTYDATIEETPLNNWFALALDPDGTSFWAADRATADVVRFDLDTGDVLDSFNTGTAPETVFGLIVNEHPAADLSIAKTLGPAIVDAGGTLSIDLEVTNAGPNPAENVVVTDDLSGFKDSTPAEHPVFESATYCEVNGEGCTGGGSFDGTIEVGSLDVGTRTFRIEAQVSDAVRGGRLGPFANDASASSTTFDPTTPNEDSENFEVNTVPNPPTGFQVVDGNGNIIVLWSEPTTDGGLPIDTYLVRYSPISMPLDVTTIEFPTPTPCVNSTESFCETVFLANGDYDVTIQAHNAIGPSDVDEDTTEIANPSADAQAQIVPAATAASLSTCKTAKPANPVCVLYKIPTGDGGVFSVFDNLPEGAFCGVGPDCAGPGVLNTLPLGYDDPFHPITLIITWDVTAHDNGLDSEVWFDADADGPNPPKLLNEFPCGPKGATTTNDPCLKKMNILGSKTNPGANGDLQVQINFTSDGVATDPKTYVR